MNKFECWILNRIIKKIVLQGGHHYKIYCLYLLIVDAAREQFTEDNKPTLDSMLKELHQKALDFNS